MFWKRYILNLKKTSNVGFHVYFGPRNLALNPFIFERCLSRLFCQASACQLEADVIFYSAAISACCADGFVNGWCHALELMRKAISTGVVNVDS